MLVGAIGPFIPPFWGFVVTFLFLIFALLKTNFFEGQTWPRWILGNLIVSLLMAVALLGLWRILPKPKEPPTADEIAEAFERRHLSKPLASELGEQQQRKQVFTNSPTAEEIADALAERIAVPKYPLDDRQISSEAYLMWNQKYFKANQFAGARADLRTYRQDYLEDQVARSISHALSYAGMKVDYRSTAKIPRSGITVRYGQHRLPEGNAACNAITESNIDTYMCLGVDDPDEFTIIVGPPSEQTMRHPVP